jgi:predicted NAD-dependent protein-ADP-ribosyltransferase YbiA (DUF1768 family)/RNA recognition motif-containing protein
MNGSNLYQSYDKAMDRQRLEEEFERNAIMLLNHQKQSRIDSFKGYFEFLSNNFLTPVYNEGILFPSISHAFQANRTTDETTKKAILNAESLLIVGKIARRIEDPEDWSLKRLIIMEKLIRDKFRRSKELLEKLKATSPRELIMTYEEESSANLFWGCVKERGQNQLGRIIMKIRNDIIENNELYNWISNCFDLIGEINYLPEINLTVKKNGENIDHIILKNRPFYLFGNLSSNDLKLEHPSISRIHAAIICDKNNGVILLDLRSKSGTRLDGDLLQDHIPYKLKNGKKINFAMSTRDYYIDIDMTKIQRMYEKEKNKLEDDYELINKIKEQNSESINIDREIIKKSFGLNENKNDNIFVNHIPYEATDIQIKYLFEDQFGRIKNFRCPVDRETGKKKGFAFIQFYDLKSAEEAVNYAIICFKEKDNIFLKIKYADPIPNWDNYNYNINREDRSNIRRRSKSKSRSRSRSKSRKRDKEKDRKRHRRYSKERNNRRRSKSRSKENRSKKYDKYNDSEIKDEKNNDLSKKNNSDIIKRKLNESKNEYEERNEYNNKERNTDRNRNKDKDQDKYSFNKDKKRKRKLSSISRNNSDNESSSSYLSSSSSDNTEKLKSSSGENSEEDNSSSSESEYSRKKNKRIRK